MEQDFIKKAKVKYLKCRQGGLHQGEIMNFICIDPACKDKGLICPVCQNSSHDGHQSMHLKIFLHQISKQLSGTSSSSGPQIGTISDHLRKLETSRKQMLCVLKDTVKQIADRVKNVEERIQEVYRSVRKSILAQTVIGTKLPHIYTLLTSEAIADEAQIIEQMQKCSELLQYKNNKVNAIDSAQKLIYEFSNIPSSMAVHLSTMIPQITKLFDSLPIKVKKFGGNQQQAVSASLQFSKTKKSSNIKLSEDSKEAEIVGQDMGGVTFVENTFAGQQKAKISFKITNNLSDSIWVGMGNPAAIQAKGYKLDEADNNGLFGICSMGIVLNDFENQSFVFSQDDIIEVEWDLQELKMTFSRRNGIQKYVVQPPITPQEAKKMSFFTSLLVPGDKVQIVQ